MKQGMTKVTVFYPAGEGHEFNMDYYCNVHTPMVADLIGDAMKGSAVEKGLGGAEPGAAPPNPFSTDAPFRESPNNLFTIGRCVLQ